MSERIVIDGHEVRREDFEHMFGPTRPPEDCRYTEYYQWWDRRHTWLKNRHPEPCCWCGGRTRHNSTCVVFEWDVRLPFGKWKGHRLSEVPDSYVKWLGLILDDLNADLQEPIKQRLEAIFEKEWIDDPKASHTRST